MVEVEHEVDNHRVTINHVKTLNLFLSPLVYLFPLIRVGSVNGLICVFHPYDVSYIFNPVVEEFMIIPKPQSNLTFLSYGFGVSMAGDSKLIRIVASFNSSETEVGVYTLATGRWRLVGQKPCHFNLTMEVGHGVFVDGHVDWLIGGHFYEFDLTTETFELFSSPPGDNQESKQMLGVLKGSLCCFSWYQLGFTVWVMKDSWYKEMAIEENIDPFLKTLEDWTPFCLIEGSKGTSILVIHTKSMTEKSVWYYCLDTNTMLQINLPSGYSTSTTMAYRPSFLKLQNFGSERVQSMIRAKDPFVKIRYKSSWKKSFDVKR